jgi:hypothetical protein
LAFTSPAVAALTSVVSALVTALQASVDQLEVSLEAALGLLSLGPPASVDVGLSAVSLTDAVAGLRAGPITDPEYPGVTVDLSTGAYPEGARAVP